jgi:hypothetical protein
MHISVASGCCSVNKLCCAALLHLSRMYLALRRSCMNQLSSELRVSGVLGSISNNKTHGFVFQARQTRDIPGMITSLPAVACAARARCLEPCDFDTAQRRLLRPASHLADLIGGEAPTDKARLQTLPAICSHPRRALCR